MLAGMGKRFLAFLIDDIIVSLIFILVVAIFYSRLPKIDFSLKTRLYHQYNM